jgi:hypothetical protein
MHRCLTAVKQAHEKDGFFLRAESFCNISGNGMERSYMGTAGMSNGRGSFWTTQVRTSAGCLSTEGKRKSIKKPQKKKKATPLLDGMAF